MYIIKKNKICVKENKILSLNASMIYLIEVLLLIKNYRVHCVCVFWLNYWWIIKYIFYQMDTGILLYNLTFNSYDALVLL